MRVVSNAELLADPMFMAEADGIGRFNLFEDPTRAVTVEMVDGEDTVTFRFSECDVFGNRWVASDRS